jgi:hypothetical protein
MSVVSLEKGLGPLNDVATHWVSAMSNGEATTGLPMMIANNLLGLSTTTEGVLAAKAVIVAFLNRDIEKTSEVWMMSDSGNITSEYVTSKPLKEMIVGLMKG